MKKYVCEVCGYIYDPAEGDPDNGVAAGTAFESLPDDWVCPCVERTRAVLRLNRHVLAFAHGQKAGH